MSELQQSSCVYEKTSYLAKDGGETERAWNFDDTDKPLYQLWPVYLETSFDAR